MSRLSRFKQAREWKPYRKLDKPPRDDDVGPRGELYETDAVGCPTERIFEAEVDKDPE